MDMAGHHHTLPNFYGHGYHWMRRGPSRLVWFGIGALFATIWAHRHSNYGAIREDRNERRIAWADRLRSEGYAATQANYAFEEKPMYNSSAHPYAHWEEEKRKIIELTARARDTVRIAPAHQALKT